MGILPSSATSITLGPFPFAGEVYCLASLFAGAKASSINALPQSSLTFSSRLFRTASQTRSHTPSLCQPWRPLWQVVSLPYTRGGFCHRAPERSTHGIPFSVGVSSVRCRPRFLDGGSSGAIFSHWGSLSSSATAQRPVRSFSHSLNQSRKWILSAY